MYTGYSKVKAHICCHWRYHVHSHMVIIANWPYLPPAKQMGLHKVKHSLIMYFPETRRFLGVARGHLFCKVILYLGEDNITKESFHYCLGSQYSTWLGWKVSITQPIEHSENSLMSADLTSLIELTLLSRCPSCKMLRSVSKMASIPLFVTSISFMPHSFRNAIATSTESSVGVSRSRVRISKATISWAWNRNKAIISTFHLHLVVLTNASQTVWRDLINRNIQI